MGLLQIENLRMLKLKRLHPLWDSQDTAGLSCPPICIQLNLPMTIQTTGYRVKETQSVLGVPSQEVNNGNTTSKTGKGRKPRASTKTSNSSAPKASKPKQSKKESLPTNKESGCIPREKPDKKSLGIVINGETYDISSIPIPVCSTTSVPRQCCNVDASVICKLTFCLGMPTF